MNSIDFYSKVANDCIPMSREEEVQIFEIYKNEKTSTSEKKRCVGKIVASNIRFLTQIARRYLSDSRFSKCKITEDDLVAEGVEALLECIPRFELEKGKRLLTYADMFIRNAMESYITRNYSSVKIPSSKRGNPFFNRQGLRLAHGADVAIKTHEDDEDGEIEISTTMHIEEDIIRMLSMTLSAIENLPERNRQIIAYRYLVENTDGGDIKNKAPMTLEEIGKVYNLTRERVRQLEVATIKKMKSEIGETALDSYSN